MEDNNNKGVKIASQISGKIIANSITEAIMPGSSFYGEILEPIVITEVEDLMSRMLSKMEQRRIDAVLMQIKSKVEQKLKEGEQPRRDDDFYVKDEYGQTSPAKLLEETLIKCKQEFEEKKLKKYANFWANICFDNNVSYEDANSLIALFSTMSYQQIIILTYLDSGEIISMTKWEKYMFFDSTLAPYFTFYTDCLQLYNTRLAVQPISDSQGIQLGTPNICISSSGHLMCKLFELEIKDEERDRLLAQIKAIDSIIIRNG